MCRLFGFRSIIRSQVHRSLLSADNALLVQSGHHPDGWGVAYYVGGAPHLIKSAASAMSDSLFQRVSGVVSSETVVAHVRKATQGNLSPLNCHPFQHGAWIFAHNGNLARFEELREELRARIQPTFRRFVLGETDSELLFFLLLSHMERRGSVHRADYTLDDLSSAIQYMLDDVRELCGDFSVDPAGPPDQTYLSFVITNGQLMIAHQGGKPIYQSTWKNRCGDRDSCPSFSRECESPTRSGFVNHLLISSEPLHGENVWTELLPGQMIGVDQRMRVRMFGAAGAGVGI